MNISSLVSLQHELPRGEDISFTLAANLDSIQNVMLTLVVNIVWDDYFGQYNYWTTALNSSDLFSVLTCSFTGLN